MFAIQPLGAALLAAALLTACRGPVSVPGNPGTPVAAVTPTPQAASLTPARDQSFSVVLEGHAAGGYEWVLQEGYDTRVVKLKGKRIGELPAQPMPGVSASEIFDFQALSAGQTTLTYALIRSWEGAKADSELRKFTVTVR